MGVWYDLDKLKEVKTMKVIIENLNGRTHNLNLSEEQVRFARWLVNNNILYDIKVIDKMDWEDIK